LCYLREALAAVVEEDVVDERHIGGRWKRKDGRGGEERVVKRVAEPAVEAAVMVRDAAHPLPGGVGAPHELNGRVVLGIRRPRGPWPAGEKERPQY